MQTVAAATPLTFALLCVMPYILTGAVEYCLTESFTARCEWNEIILIEKALFGRMELGKCVTRNFGHVGCQADVLNQLDHACSGLPECDFSVSDPSLVRMKPCPKDFTSYLDATYDCVPVIRNIREECLPTGVQIVSSPKGFITSSMATTTMHVTSSHLADGYARGTLAPSSLLTPPSSVDILPCPIEFRFHLGQRLNLTLLDFALRNRSSQMATGSHEDDAAAAKYCFRYAIVDEPATGNSVTVCGGGQRRERHVYLSRSNLVRVQLLPGNLTRFLLRFEVIGCSDPVLPSDMHARHHLDRVVVFCNRTTESFILICDNNRWKGEMRNCSRPGSPQRKHQSDFPTDILGLPHIGMSIAIILGVAMVTVVYVAIIMVCVLHVRRWRQKFRPVQSRDPLKQPEVDRRCGTLTPSSQTLDLVLGERTPIILREKLTRNEAGQRYSEVFQLRSGSTAAAVPSRGDWPRVAAIEAFRYCRHSLGDHTGGGGCPCVSPLDCASHWGALHDGGYEAAEREDQQQQQLRRDVAYGVAKTTVAMGTVVAMDAVARGAVAKGEVQTVPVVSPPPPQRVYSSPDVVAVGRKTVDGKCPD